MLGDELDDDERGDELEELGDELDDDELDDELEGCDELDDELEEVFSGDSKAPAASNCASSCGVNSKSPSVLLLLFPSRNSFLFFWVDLFLAPVDREPSGGA